MRFVNKRVFGDYQLRNAHKNPQQTSQDATTRWRRFSGKPQVMQSLLDEQYQLCCYSELCADEVGHDYHIEHVENKSQNPQRTFDYSNLAASALSSDDLQVFKAQGKEVFGGHAAGKQQGVNMQRFISCHQADCRRYFAYLSDGRVVPSTKLEVPDIDKAQYTIDVLNLNSPYLITLRKQWWDELDQWFVQHQQKNWDLDALASGDLVPHSQRLSRFFSLTRQFYGLRAEQVIQRDATQLL